MEMMNSSSLDSWCSSFVPRELRGVGRCGPVHGWAAFLEHRPLGVPALG